MIRKLYLLFSIVIYGSICLSANRFIEKSFYSQALGKDKTYFVSYPDGYVESDTTQKYPVIIFLHGASVNAEQMVMPLELILPYSQSLYKNLFKVIFVIPDGSVEPYLGSFYTNSELYGNFEDYISTDLYNEINNNYHTWNIREKWSIMGHSMGGYGSMKIALKHLENYIGIASLSAPLHITYYNNYIPYLLSEHGDSAPYNFTYTGSLTKMVYTMAGAFSPDTSSNPPIQFPVTSEGTIDQSVASKWEVHNPINMIKGWDNNHQIAIFLYCGELDDFKLLPQNQFFADTLTKYNIPFTFRIDPYGDHTQSLATSFPLGLNFLFNVMDTCKVENGNNVFDNTLLKSDYIFPNPVYDQLFLKTIDFKRIRGSSIYSIQGSLIKELNIEVIQDGLNISELQPGVYFLKITYSDNNERIFRFFKTNI